MNEQVDPPAILHIQHPDGTLQQHPLPLAVPFSLGRDPEADIVLHSPAVSRLHLVLELTSQGLRIEDRSTNGTYVGNRHLLQSSALASCGETVLVGGFKLSLARQDAKPPSTAKAATVAPADATLRRRVHSTLLERLDLKAFDRQKCKDESLRPAVRHALTKIIQSMRPELPAGFDEATLIDEMADEALGLGPLEKLLADEAISEIMVIDAQTIFVEERGRLRRHQARFTDDEAVRAVIERIITPLGRRIDESVPLVDARLADGSRVNAIIAPLAIRGPCLTIRKFAKRQLTMAELVRAGSLNEAMMVFLQRCVQARKNIVVSGGTGSGKTTLLNLLASSIPPAERIVTIEDAAELRLAQPHVVSLETRPPNMEGRGEYTIRDLVRNALRMRPDRLLVGECRGGEAIDMLQAMNTGHEGSMTTTHANGPRQAVARLETLCLMSGVELPMRAIRQQIAASVHLVLQQERASDGKRRIVSIAEVTGLSEHDEVELQEIFVFRRASSAAEGAAAGSHRATGYVPTFVSEFTRLGVAADEVFG